jgi:hypothetical protein
MSTKLQCNEHFHHTQGTQHTSTRVRACQSSLHSTHYICIDCHYKAFSWLTRHEQDIEEEYLMEDLCRDCATDIEIHGLTYGICRSWTVKCDDRIPWFCFECRSTHLWRAAVRGEYVPRRKGRGRERGEHRTPWSISENRMRESVFGDEEVIEPIRKWNFPRHPARTPYNNEYQPPPRPSRRYTREEMI